MRYRAWERGGSADSAGRVAVVGDLKVLRAHGVRCGFISDERRPSRRLLIVEEVACLRSINLPDPGSTRHLYLITL